MAIALTSMGSIAQWMDSNVTSMFVNIVTPMVAKFTDSIMPVVSIGLSVTLIWYGWLISSGAIPTPILTALRRIVNISIIVSVAGAGGLYQKQIAGVLLDLPTAMTSALHSQPTTPAEIIDDVANKGAELSTKLNDRAPSGISQAARAFAFVLVAIVITVLSTVFGALGMVVLLTVKVGMGVCVVLGPLLILALLFDYTKTYFRQWLNQVLYFGLYAAAFTIVFTFVIQMFGMLQDALLGVTTADQINIFGIMSMLLFFVFAAGAIIRMVPEIVGALTGGRSSGVSLPVIGRVG